MRNPHLQSTLWRWGRLALLGGMVLTLSACGSHSRRVASNLDTQHPRYTSPECRLARGRVQVHDDIQQTRVLASPLAVLLGGGAWFLPVLAINAGLDAADHLEASDISVDCGGPETPNADIALDVIMGVGFSIGLGK